MIIHQVKMSYVFRDRRGDVYVFGDNRNQRIYPDKVKLLEELTQRPLNFPVARISRNCTSCMGTAFLISPKGSIQNTSSQEEVFLKKSNGEMIHVIDVSYIQQYRPKRDQYRNYGILIVLANDGYIYIRPSPVDLAREGRQNDPSLMAKLRGFPFIKKLSHHCQISDYRDAPFFYVIDENDQPVSFRVIEKRNGYRVLRYRIDFKVETRFKDIWTFNRRSYFLDVEGRIYRDKIKEDQISLVRADGLPPIEKIAVLEGGLRSSVCLLDKNNRVLVAGDYHREKWDRVVTKIVTRKACKILASSDSLFILLNDGRILQRKFFGDEDIWVPRSGTRDVTELFEGVDIIFDEDEFPSRRSTKSARY